MIKEIRIELEYGAYPIWLIDENGIIIDTDIPNDIKENNPIIIKINLLQNTYDSLFVNTAKDFYFDETIQTKKKILIENLFKEVANYFQHYLATSYVININPPLF